MMSLPSRERGLKSRPARCLMAGQQSLPSRERGLKSQLDDHCLRPVGRSRHGSGVCNFRSSGSPEILCGRSLHGSVD